MASLLCVTKLAAQPFGSWDFNSSNLTATVGSDLGYADGPGGATESSTAFGTTTGFGITDIAGLPATVLRFPAATNGEGYSMPTPSANGGGSAVNQYTLLMDVLYPAASIGKTRPLIQTEDGSHLGAQQFIVVDGASGGVGPAAIGSGAVSGPYVGSLAANTWYRIGIVVTAGGTTRVYTNGVEMGSFSGGDVDGFFALNPDANALILANTTGDAATGYVNSVQLRDVALSAGQIAALGKASAAGIPSVIPPVPPFIASRNPGASQTGVSEEPAINVVLDQGDATITSGSVKLYLDGVAVGTVTETPPIFTVTYTVPPRLDPLSQHNLMLTWHDSMLGNNTNSWSFTVKNYQVVTLPTPFFYEDFDSLTENPTPGVALPAGWTVQDQSASDNPGFNLDDRDSDSYKGWILVNSSRLNGWGSERTNLPTIILNGTKITGLTSGNLLWAESDQRCGGCNGQFADLFTAPISCVGRSNVFVAFNSIYEQNQDNMDFMEYSVDGGANWLPVLYYFDDDPANSDIIFTNGVADVGATFARVDVDRNWSPDTTPVHATNYGFYVSSPISSIKPTDIKGRLNDDTFDGKRIEVIRLPAADGQANVRFRMNANGTSAWFWGIDNFGLYEINTPVFATQPANTTVAAGTSTNLTVVVSSSSAVGYQWQHSGANLSDAGHFSGVKTATLTISNADPSDAGLYRCIATNADGATTSSPGTLTVVTVPTITTQPASAVVSDGYPVSLNGMGFGGLPLTYIWKLNGTPVAYGPTYNLASAHVAEAGNYTLVVTNNYGAVTSIVAQLDVVAVTVTNGLVVHLKFDNDYTDSSGRGNDGIPIGSPTFTAGKIGNAMQYTDADGGVSANYVSLDNPIGTHPADLRMGANTSFSISFWYRVPTGNRHGDPALVSNKDWDSGGNTGFVIFNSGSGLAWNFTQVNDGVNANTRKDSGGTSPGLEDGNWHHCVVVYQRGGGGFSYVDGTLVKFLPLATPNPAGGFFAPTTIDNDPANAKTATATGAWNIGEDGSGLYTLHDGGVSVTNAMIDDVGIWRRTLSAQEALAIYTAGLAGQDLSQAVPSVSAPLLSITQSGSNVNIVWVGTPTFKLQEAGSLNPTNWTDVPGTLGASFASVPMTNHAAFFRLSQ